jgi:hypothetical protein
MDRYLPKNKREMRRLHNEELNDLYCLPNIVGLIKSRGMRWAWHFVRVGESRGADRVLVGKLEGKKPLEKPGVGGRIILKWISRKWDLGTWTGYHWLMTGTSVGHL